VRQSQLAMALVIVRKVNRQHSSPPTLRNHILNVALLAGT
jgi:hypothetical protein